MGPDVRTSTSRPIQHSAREHSARRSRKRVKPARTARRWGCAGKTWTSTPACSRSASPCLVEPKTRRSRRTLPLPREVTAQLRAHRARQREEQLRAGQAWRGDDWGLVFATPNGEPLDDRVLRYRFKRLLVSAGLPRIRFHDLRHSCASLLVAHGVQPRLVMEILGHSEIGTTMNTYSHVIPEAMRQAIGTLDRILVAGD
ncbi:MAG TPA: site-specific integrase [Thermomicrobiales bacterium]|nr:site-specific integrase [Thermomicrobiales bacterium]